MRNRSLVVVLGFKRVLVGTKLKSMTKSRKNIGGSLEKENAVKKSHRQK